MTALLAVDSGAVNVSVSCCGASWSGFTLTRNPEGRGGGREICFESVFTWGGGEGGGGVVECTVRKSGTGMRKQNAKAYLAIS